MADSTSAESPAEVMRRAAKLMRERADAIPHGPWHWQALGEHGYPQRVINEGAYLIAECFTGPDVRLVEAEYIASMHPGIGSAVADLLEEIARQYDAPPCDSPDGVCNGCEWREDFNDAVRLAQVYLGEDRL